MAINRTEITGIFASDIILRTALIAGIQDLRAHPRLLEYCFASLPKDELTAKKYGQQQVDEAIKWFQATEFQIALNLNVDAVKLPCISIALMSSDEAENTLSDTHYQPFEDDSNDPYILIPKFDPISYDQTTGLITLADADVANMVIAPGMLVVDRAGNSYEIIASETRNEAQVAPGTIADFNQAFIKAADPAYVTAIESLTHKEVYAIGVHVHGEPVQLVYLHSIVLFILNRYKQDLLEGRGLERTSTTSADLGINTFFEKENVYTRFVQLTGYVRQSWPKTTTLKIQSVLTAVRPADTAAASLSIDPDRDPITGEIFNG